MANELIRWNKLKQAIVEAKSIDEVKLIKDKAEAMRAYSKQIGESLTVQNDICEIKLRAERRMGEMLKETELYKGGGQLPKEKRSHDVTTSLKLVEIGLQKHQSARYQKIADLPKETFEKIITETKKEEKELTEALMINTSKKIDREIQINEMKDSIEKGTAKLPEGKFEVIVVDPPWDYKTPYDPDGFRGITPYPTMSIEELKKVELPSTDDCVLWLWTTHRFMRHSFEILDKWGFEEKAILTWVKNKMGIGKWLRSKSEFCIMAVKGKPLINLTNQTTVLLADVKEHSKKPDEFYKMVDELCIGRKLDYFSRQEREGWEIYGIKEEIKNG